MCNLITPHPHKENKKNLRGTSPLYQGFKSVPEPTQHVVFFFQCIKRLQKGNAVDTDTKKREQTKTTNLIMDSVFRLALQE